MNDQNFTLFPIEQYQKNTYSYSQLKTYSQCKLRYKLKYVEKKLRQDQKSTFYLSLGRSIHSFLEKFYKENHFLMRNQSDISDLFKETWISEGYKDFLEEKKWFGKSLRMINDFIERDNYQREPFLLETTFSQDVEGFEITSRIDRIDKISETSCEIIDYKVGETEVGIDILKNDLQWAFHIISSSETLKNVYGVKPTIISFIFLDANIIDEIKPSDQDIIEIREKIIKSVREIENQIEFPPTLNKFCLDCRFDLVCPLIHELKKNNVDLNVYLKNL